MFLSVNKRADAILFTRAMPACTSLLKYDRCSFSSRVQCTSINNLYLMMKIPWVQTKSTKKKIQTQTKIQTKLRNKIQTKGREVEIWRQ